MYIVKTTVQFGLKTILIGLSEIMTGEEQSIVVSLIYNKLTNLF